MPAYKHVIARFCEKVVVGREPGDCWGWTAYTDHKGYGRLGWKGNKLIRAHRLSWILYNGDPGPLCVLHKCDNPPCCNPKHLFLGTQLDNVNDRVQKGRDVPTLGMAQRSAKLCDDDVPVIRAKLARGETLRSIGADFGVSHRTILDIKWGTKWKHV